jgi:hypothetical protein
MSDGVQKMTDEVRSGMVNFISEAYAAESGEHTERGLRDFAAGVMAVVKMQSGVGWRKSTRKAVEAALRVSAMASGWALVAGPQEGGQN